MDTEDVARWVGHSPMSDPGRHGRALADVPPGVGALTRAVQGLLVHSDWLDTYGLHDPALAKASRTTLPVADRLDDIVARDPRPFAIGRPPGRRSIGTCRDFALLSCSALRSRGIPARLRCGFAAYLGKGWEDHWICEYWDRQDAAWHVCDPQLDDVLTAKLGIAFDPTDVPRSSFMTAGEAWSACRGGLLDTDRVGKGDLTGLWFMKINVIRDHLALHGREVSAWDGWREATSAQRSIRDHEVARLDDLAARPGQGLVEIPPDWLW